MLPIFFSLLFLTARSTCLHFWLLCHRGSVASLQVAYMWPGLLSRPKQADKGRFLHTVQAFSLQNTGTASKALLWNDPQPLLIPESPTGIITKA